MAKGEWKGLILAGLYTGQRLGDLARLRWDAVDFERAILTLTTRKTIRRQILPIPSGLLGWLKAAHRASPANAAEIFPQANEKVRVKERVGLLSNQFHRLMVEAGVAEPRSHQKLKAGRKGPRDVSQVSFHSLRHTVTSLLKNAGGSPAIVQEFVGHESKAVSQNYTHIDTAALRKAAALLPDLAEMGLTEQS